MNALHVLAADGRGTGTGRLGRGRGAFTLIELLIVIAVILLLISIVTPSMRVVREHAMNAICQQNLLRLPNALHQRGADIPGAFPKYYEWLSYASQRGGAGLLKCPKDSWEGRQPTPIPGGGGSTTYTPGSLAGVYIRQLHGSKPYYTYLEDLFAGTLGPDRDPQVRLNPTGVHSEHGWVYPIPGPNQALVSVDDDAGIMVTFGDPILIEALDPPGHRFTLGSDHWVGRGIGGTNWQSEVLMQLTGKNYHQIDPRSPVRLEGSGTSTPGAGGTGIASYGMNIMVSDRSPRGKQLLLVEYNSIFVDVDGQLQTTTGQTGGMVEDDFDNLIAPRHFGLANYVTVDGSVRQAYQWELQPQYPPLKPNPIWMP